MVDHKAFSSPIKLYLKAVVIRTTRIKIGNLFETKPSAKMRCAFDSFFWQLWEM